jgi:23S rRNA pseudouridine2457 synthase
MEDKKVELKYYVFYKPYNVLNQFTRQHHEHITLANYLRVDKDVYPIGRLDKDSEGLLILSNDKKLNSHLLSPSKMHKRIYMVQLDNDITDKAIAQVAAGIEIKLDSGMYKTKPCTVKKLHKEPILPERVPAVRFRKDIATSWALIELMEGKNRQVRRMFAAVDFPVLRLVRVQIEDLKIGKLEPGKYHEISQDELFKLIKINKDDLNVKKVAKRIAKGGKIYTPTPTVGRSRSSSKSAPKSDSSTTKRAIRKPKVKAEKPAFSKDKKTTTEEWEANPTKKGAKSTTTRSKTSDKPTSKTGSRPTTRSGDKPTYKSGPRSTSKDGSKPTSKSSSKGGPRSTSTSRTTSKPQLKSKAKSRDNNSKKSYFDR